MAKCGVPMGIPKNETEVAKCGVRIGGRLGLIRHSSIVIRHFQRRCMMAKDIDRICDKYEYKLRDGRTASRSDQDRERQAEGYRRGAARNEEVRSAVAAVISRVGVSTIWWAFYYDFGRTLARLKARDGSPESLHSEARMQLEVWVARGLVREVLEQVARECFELDLTGPIPTLAQPPERA
jgi:hypothetical protein